MKPARKNPPWLPKRPTAAAKILEVAEVLSAPVGAFTREQFVQRLTAAGWHCSSALAAFQNHQRGLQ